SQIDPSSANSYDSCGLLIRLWCRLYPKYTTSPMISQMIRGAQLIQPNLYIIYPLNPMPRMGTIGTSGVRNGLGCCGFVLRNTITAMQTITNASNVPMLTILPISSMGVVLPTIAASRPTAMVFL